MDKDMKKRKETFTDKQKERGELREVTGKKICPTYPLVVPWLWLPGTFNVVHLKT